MTDDGYDIIGDVHGSADKLERLLDTMEYSEVDGSWKHPTRRAVFVGDFVDRGPQQLRAVEIPKMMVEAGNALAVAGNHEFNAASLATKDPWGEWNRKHSPHNLEQSSVFREAIGFGSAAHSEVIDWFMTLPLWLDLDGLRVVHACWYEPAMRVLEEFLTDDLTMTSDLLVAANVPFTPAFNAIEIVLKGPEAPLAGHSYEDKDGIRRRYGRLTWWDPQATTIRSAVQLASDWQVFAPDGSPVDELPDVPLPLGFHGMTSTDPTRPPTVFGHYWFSAGPNDETLRVINPKAACVDFSAVKGGPLVAYRWSGEAELDSDNLVAAR